MAEKKAVKRKKKGQSDDTGPSKDEEEVAKYLRFNLETKKSVMYGDESFYFMGSKAVDFLMDSKWAKGSKSSVVLTHRESVAAFLNKLLSYGMISHVNVTKTEKKVKEKKKNGDKKKDDEKKKEAKKKEDRKSEEKESKDEKKELKKMPGSPKGKKDKDGKEGKKVKKKVKITLEPSDIQVFLDSDIEGYVWIYDPVSWKTLILGILLVLAIIAICLFPLWPESVREYSWYLSVAGAIFVGAIIVLAVLRYIIYGFLWICTFGKLHFWLLPNLTAECGFLESFVPAYEYEVRKKEEEKNDEDEDEEEGVEDKLKMSRMKQESGTPSDKGNDEKPEIIAKQAYTERTEIVLDEANIEQDKQENESEESSGSTKEEDWIKVKKGDAEENKSGRESIEC